MQRPPFVEITRERRDEHPLNVAFPHLAKTASLLNPSAMGVSAASIALQPYWLCVVVLAAIFCIMLIAARRSPGPWTDVAAKAIGLILLGDCVVDTARQVHDGTWSLHASLPLALCNFTLLVGAAACWWLTPQLIELTYYWGLAGALQGLVTPDLNVPYPQVEFFEYVVGHTVTILAALFLVIGLRRSPRRGSVVRSSIVTYLYAAVVALCDIALNANYMFFRRTPRQWTLLRLMGPYPWYLVTGVIIVPLFFAILYSPFWFVRRSTDAARTSSRAMHA
jgi:hypothetical integral membrane protein (TIGR02206 family)